MTFQLIATMCAALFTGAAIYINLVEHPARMSLGAAVALAEWKPSYHRATLMQAPLAIAGLLAALGAWAVGDGRGWLLGGLVLGAVVPFTLLVIFATNDQLQRLDPADEGDLDRAHVLLQRWNRLHAVRSLLSFIALVTFLVLLR